MVIPHFYIQITGSARGLGRELSLAFHRLGASIVCVDIDEEGNEMTSEMIRGEGGTVRAFTLDITDREKIRSMHEAVKNDLGPVDILVNNAAVVRTNIYVNSKTDELVREIIDVNVLGQFWVCKQQLNLEAKLLYQALIKCIPVDHQLFLT